MNRRLSIHRDGSGVEITTDSGTKIELTGESARRALDELDVYDKGEDCTVVVPEKKWDDMGRRSFR